MPGSECHRHCFRSRRYTSRNHPGLPVFHPTKTSLPLPVALAIYLYWFIYRIFDKLTGSASIRIPRQFNSISRNRVLDLVSPSRAPHSMKIPFFWNDQNLKMCWTILLQKIEVLSLWLLKCIDMNFKENRKKWYFLVCRLSVTFFEDVELCDRKLINRKSNQKSASKNHISVILESNAKNAF